MQKLFATLTLCLSVFIFSCSDKEPDIVDPGPDPNLEPTDTTAISKNLLGKTVLTSGADVTTKIYQYDANNRLVWYSNTSTKADYFEDTSRIIRDNDGRIQQIIYRSDTSRKYNDPALDSITFQVFYDAAASKYTHKISQYKLYRFNFKDSTAYSYDGQNRIIKQETFYFDYITTKTYQPSAKTDYTYDAAGNMTKLNTVFYKVDGTNDYPYEIVYTYDPKGENLLNLGNEAIVLGLEQDFSADAPKTMVGTYPMSPQYNRSLTYAYTFNTKYRPLRADITAAGGGAASTMVYTYQ